MDRQEALTLLKTHLKDDKLVKHCLATEAIMKALAVRLGENPDTWGLAGLLHDIDFEETRNTPAQHTLPAAELLGRAGVSGEIIGAIREHNAEALGIQRAAKLGIALASAETLTGLIVAVALVMPDKKLAAVKAKSVIKRMKEKDFARAVNRDIIRECEKLGLSLEDTDRGPGFVTLSIAAMQAIAGELGL